MRSTHHKLAALLLFIIISFKSWSQCTAPTNQPTASNVTSKNSKSIAANFTAAAGAGANHSYLVVRSDLGSTLTVNPVNGTTYTPNQQLGNGTVVSVNSRTSFTADGLSPNTTYHFFVFSVNTSGHCYNVTSPLSFTQATDPSTVSGGASATINEQSKKSELMPLLNFNFAGKKNSWTNMTPGVFYGWSVENSIMRTINKGKDNESQIQVFGHTFQGGPYVGSTIAIKDSTSFLPALMLPGNAGLELNYYLTLFNPRKFSVVICPMNLGLKVISGFTDSTLSLVQHSVRHSAAIQFAEYFTASVQYTTGWHNASSFSQENFNKIFKNPATNKVAYWNVTFTSRLSKNIFGGEGDKKTPLFLFVSWRSFVKPSDKYALPNTRIFTLGLTASLDLKSGSNPGLTPQLPRN